MNKAFISYSHHDSSMLELLHTHLSHLKREGLIKVWTDEDINAGGRLEASISDELSTANLFIALLSPSYIASNYCYEKEFMAALELEKQGGITIIPLIVEPCEWIETPFGAFKGIPKDGKPVSTWENRNTAFLDVIQNIRKLLTSPTKSIQPLVRKSAESATALRNYRIKKDFDSIQKLEFTEKTFHDVRELLKRFLDEVIELDGISAKPTLDSAKEFECWLVNRNMINTESLLKLSTQPENNNRFGFTRQSDNVLTYTITQNGNPAVKSFGLQFDEFQLFWSEESAYYNRSGRTKMEAKDIADAIWAEWLTSVGILFQ